MESTQVYKQLDAYVKRPGPESRWQQLMTRLETQVYVIIYYRNWLTNFLDYFKMIKTPTVLYRFRNGLKYRIRPGTTDRGVLNEIWIRRDYSPNGIDINPTDIVVDIGGQIGTFTVMAAWKANKGHVYTFEPTSLNFPMLQENVAINNLTNVTLYKKAVSDTNGIAYMHLSSDNTGGHSLSWKTDEKQQKEAVPTITLATLMEDNEIDHIDFLKMDCEGAEYDIFYTAPLDVLGRIRKIAIEYHMVDDARNGEMLKRFLEEHGFKAWIHRSLLYALNTNSN